MKNLIRNCSVFAATAAVAVAAFAAPAAAEQAGPATAAVPNCVHTDTGWSLGWRYVDVTNDCGKYKRVMAIISDAQDSRCMGIRPGQTKTDRYGPQGQFERLVSC
ncbi:hypothetical protein [Streptomonospora wellingtoniae]|uniref:Alpha-amylase n=1 Tax=Streptomonospora wellingtoniae TaxID=3075544 RepID=A0ABU2L1E7_9ACTN|nr:hypothetical protein [Streptomonospora sp. DSM 45055]MDT0305231.1 hypothetical protein [Streptomonospora sp. DSM 45055]